MLGTRKEDLDNKSTALKHQFINQKQTIMRTLDNNQITQRIANTKGQVWNQKRRYR